MASRSIKQKSEASYDVGSANQRTDTSERKYSLTTYSTQLLDSNIERLKSKCLKLEIASKRSRSFKKRTTVEGTSEPNRRLSVPSLKQAT
jgi:hypothetical protein